MIQCILVLILLLIGPSPEAWPQNKPTTLCLRTDTPPTIDGRGDETVWQKAEALRLVDVSDLNYSEHALGTEVRLLWDGAALYMLFTANDPDVWSTLTDRDAPLFEEEVIEIFIEPDGNGRNYAEIAINPVNALFDMLVPGDGSSGIAQWNPEMETAVSVTGTANDPSDTDQHWTIEIALPWQALNTRLLDVTRFQEAPPLIGDRWRFNFYRYERLRENGLPTGEIQYSAWSPTGAINFHVPALFGTVIFASAEGDFASEGEDDAYPPGTLTPSIDLGLRPTLVQVTERFTSLPEGLSLNLPPGFSVNAFAAGFSWPRLMAFDDNQVLHLADAGSDRIYALPDRDRDGVADEFIIAAEGFELAHSLAFYQGELYVADTHQVLKLNDADGDLIYEQSEILIDHIPSAAWHTTRTIVIDEQREKIYLSVGSPCDLCRSSSPVAGGSDEPLPPNPEWGTILEFNIDGTGRRIFATGVRNAVGLALHPTSNELWGNNNGHDLEGRRRPPEWIDIIRDGDFMGHPLVHSHQVWNDFTSRKRYQRMLPITKEDSLLATTQKKPVALVPAHYAPMGLHFYTEDLFPARYKNAAFVAFRAGQAKLSSHPGYNVSALFSDPDGSNARIGEFITGFQTGTTEGSVWGYPMGLITDREGNLYVGSDALNRMILKVSYNPITAIWDHDLPTAIARTRELSIDSTVRLTHYDANGPAPIVTIDLSALGGPAALALTPVGNDTYALDTHLNLQDVPFGTHTVQLLVEQATSTGPIFQRHLHKIIVSEPDLPIFDEILAADWQLKNEGGAQVLDLDPADPVFTGQTAIAIRAEPANFFTPWAIELAPPAAIERGDRAGLRFAFHPGEMQLPNQPNMVLYIDGLPADLLQGPESFRLDLVRREWQIIEIPFKTFDVIQKYGTPIVLDSVKTIPSLRLEGNITGAFYLDDIRLVASIPAGPLREASTAIIEEAQHAQPTAFVLEQNYPNPFNSGTIIDYGLPERATVFLDVYNLAGQQVARLAYGLREAGAHRVQWDGRDNADEKLATGMYLYRLRAGGHTTTRKLMLIR